MNELINSIKLNLYDKAGPVLYLATSLFHGVAMELSIYFSGFLVNEDWVKKSFTLVKLFFKIIGIGIRHLSFLF